MGEQNIEKKDFLKMFFNQYVRHSSHLKTFALLTNMEQLIHTNYIYDNDMVLKYFFHIFSDIIRTDVTIELLI